MSFRVHEWHFITLILLIIIIIPDNINFENTSTAIPHQSKFLSYTERGPITIDGNADFEAQASVNSWPGSGSDSDPYFINALKIESSSTSVQLVNIANTTVHFVVNGCLFIGGGVGFRLHNVTNGNLSTSFISHVSGIGVYISRSSEIDIMNTEIWDCSSNGILVDYSSDCSIVRTKIRHVDSDGIKFRDSDWNTITQSNISFCQTGITLGHSLFNEISWCSINNQTQTGISVQESMNNTILENAVFQNSMLGLSIEGSDFIKVMNNTFYRNQLAALRTFSDYGSIEGNNFIENTDRRSSTYPPQVVDDGSTNIFEGNFWDEWTYPDSDDNDVVDGPYWISSLTQDFTPVVNAHETPLLHVLTQPLLLSPNESLETRYFFGVVDILWSPASDTFGHVVEYNLFYATDSGVSWDIIIEAIKTTAFLWNTTLLPQNLTYKIRVQSRCERELGSSARAEPEFILREHTLAPPSIIIPNGGEVMNPGDKILWTSAVDSWEHIVLYDVYISPNAGEEWVQLESDTQEHHTGIKYESMPEGNQYIVRVVATCEDGLSEEVISDAVFTVKSSYVLEYLSIFMATITIVCIVIVVIRHKMRIKP